MPMMPSPLQECIGVCRIDMWLLLRVVGHLGMCAWAVVSFRIDLCALEVTGVRCSGEPKWLSETLGS